MYRHTYIHTYTHPCTHTHTHARARMHTHMELIFNYFRSGTETAKLNPGNFGVNSPLIVKFRFTDTATDTKNRAQTAKNFVP